MNWIELIIHTTTAGAEDVSALLMDLGAGGTQIEDRADIPDPAKPNGIWEIIDPALPESMPEPFLLSPSMRTASIRPTNSCLQTMGST